MQEAERFPGWHGTTIVAVRKGGKVVVAGDGQVSLGQTVIKGTARKVRRITPGGQPVLCGFAGSTADAFTLLERLEKKLEAAPGQLQRAAVELAKDWRTDKYLRNLEAMLIVTDGAELYVITGAGDVLEPEHDVTAIGSGGNYALAAARALYGPATSTPRRSPARPWRSPPTSASTPTATVTVESPREMTDLTPREIVSELDRFIIGQKDAKRAVAVALRNRWRRKQLARRHPRRGLSEEHPDDRPDRRRQDRDLAPPGQARQGAVPQGRGDQVHRGRLRRPRRRADRPRPRRRRRRHGPRGHARAGQGPRPRGRREPRARRARRRRRARPDPRDVPQASSAPASSTTRRSSSRSPTPPARSR